MLPLRAAFSCHFFKAWNTEHTEPDQGVKGDKGNRHIAFGGVWSQQIMK